MDSAKLEVIMLKIFRKTVSTWKKILFYFFDFHLALFLFNSFYFICVMCSVGMECACAFKLRMWIVYGVLLLSGRVFTSTIPLNHSVVEHVIWWASKRCVRSIEWLVYSCDGTKILAADETLQFLKWKGKYISIENPPPFAIAYDLLKKHNLYI